MARILGNTGLGRFQPEEITLADGTSAWLYCLKEKRGLKSYAALLVPGALEPYLYMREDALTGRTVDYVTPTGFKTQYKERQKGKWQRVNRLPDSLDCSSYPNEFVSPGATDWWIEWAGKKGLAADMEPTTRSLNLLGILMDTRAKPLAGGLCDG
jgi:hypothetical protein